jgi:hypothetical protein
MLIIFKECENKYCGDNHNMIYLFKKFNINKKKVQLINVNSKMKKILKLLSDKKGRTYPLVKISFFNDIDSLE